MSGARKTNAEIRKWYLEHVAQIPELNEQWMVQGLTAKERAKKAWQIRYDARLQAREMMADPEEVEMLRTRDVAKYGNEDGPTFEFLVREWWDAGLRGNVIYTAIIKGARRTNRSVNKKFGL